MNSLKSLLKSVRVESLPIPGDEPWYVTEKDPALLVMIDFRSRHSVTVFEESTMDEALSHFKHSGVRCGFVVDKKRKAVVGMLTAYDISGEKAQKYIHFTGVSRADVQVKDIMQKINELKVADIKDIEKSTVGDVLKLFKETGATHMPIMETTENNEQHLRGLFSFAKVKRLLAAT